MTTARMLVLQRSVQLHPKYCGVLEDGLTEEDLGKLNKTDEYDEELHLMAEVRAYSHVRVAYKARSFCTRVKTILISSLTLCSE